MGGINTCSFSKPKLFLTTLFLAANVTTIAIAPRLIHIHRLTEPGGIFIFPLTFFFSDIITEIYGYKYARTLVWCVILLKAFFTFGIWFSMLLPATFVNFNIKHFFSLYPKLFISGCIGFFLSYFINNYILAKSKIMLKGKLFWIRSICSSSIGHFVYSFTWLFIFWAGSGIGSWNMLKIVGCMYIWKLGFEIFATPFAVLIVSWLKRIEGDEVFDYHTNFNPFII